MNDKYIEWYRGGDTGMSSETIFEVMTNIPVKRHDIPYDPSDFGRCHRLLELFPEWRSRLDEVAQRFPVWKPFVDNWAKMEEIYLRDLPTDKSAELYDLMRSFREDKRHWTEQLTQRHKESK